MTASCASMVAGTSSLDPRIALLFLLLVPGLDAELPGDLAVSHLERGGAQHAGSVRVLARLVKRYALLSDDLVLDARLEVPTADIFQILGDLLSAAQHVRRAWRSLAVDDVHLSVFG